MPPRKSAPKKSLPDSIRIKIGGSGHVWTTAQQREMVIEAFAYIEETLGIHHGKSFFLYHRPTDEKGNPITHARGEPLKEITIDRPYDSAADEHGA